jgi:hypothetical protein
MFSTFNLVESPILRSADEVGPVEHPSLGVGQVSAAFSPVLKLLKKLLKGSTLATLLASLPTIQSIDLSPTMPNKLVMLA